MAHVVIMPRQGQSVESCIITEWKKKVGDKVAVKDVLFSYETDKSSFDELSEVEGTLLAVFAAEGDDVECLRPVCVIGNEGEGMSRLVSEACDFKVSIPMHGRISSLNASNAAAILLYEAVRQRG